jgi:hypothetical protein
VSLGRIAIISTVESHVSPADSPIPPMAPDKEDRCSVGRR